MSALEPARPSGSRRTSRPRRAGAAATTSRCSSPAATTARSRTRASATCREFLAPATCSSSTPPRRCPPRSTRGSATAQVELRLSTPVPEPATALGRRAAHRRRGCRSARPPIGRVLELPGGARRRAARALRRQRPALRSRGSSSPRPLERLPRPPRPPDPLRLRPEAVADRGLPDGLRARAGQRRDAERRPPVHPRARHRAGLARRPRRADHAAHRRLVARARRAAVPRALPRAGGRPRASSTPCTAGAAA